MDCKKPHLVLEGLKKGADWAFECLYDKCYPIFFKRTINNFANDSSDIEDIYYQTLENLIVKLMKEPDWFPNKDIFAYFSVMLYNKGMDYSKKIAKLKTTDLSKISPFLSDEMPEYFDYSEIYSYYQDCMEIIRTQNPKAAKAIESNNSNKFIFRDEFLAITEEELAIILGLTIESLKVFRSRWWRRLLACVENKLE